MDTGGHRLITPAVEIAVKVALAITLLPTAPHPGHRWPVREAAPIVRTTPAPAPSYTGGVLSYEQVVELARAAGFPAGLAPTMAAIAWRESRFDPNALNPSGACGLWQILSHPTPAGCFDPATNAGLAFQKFVAAGYSLSPWR